MKTIYSIKYKAKYDNCSSVYIWYCYAKNREHAQIKWDDSNQDNIWEQITEPMIAH